MRNVRAWIYVIAALVLAALAFAPQAWATPDRTVRNQTVPTLTPTSGFKAPTPIVTAPPGPQPPGPGITPQPGPGPQLGPNPQPGPQPPGSQPLGPAAVAPGVPAATATAAAAAQPLRLTVVVSPTLAWPGARLQFTVTVANAGSLPLANVTLAEYLAEGLLPEAAASRYTWSGRNLSVPFGTLPPGQQIVLPFAIVVGRDVRPGAVLQVVGIAAADGVAPAFVQTLIPLPPAELPRTGGDLRQAGAVTK